MKFTLILLALMDVAAFAAEKIPLPTAHTSRHIEGWTVRVDNRLLHGDSAAVGELALKLLRSRLVAVTIVVPEKSLAKLRAITIELDLNYGGLRAMQYHPDAGWLKEHGYSEQLAKCVHIPEVEDFFSPCCSVRKKRPSARICSSKRSPARARSPSAAAHGNTSTTPAPAGIATKPVRSLSLSFCPTPRPTPPGHLYNLDTDPGETKNLYAERPEIVWELKAILDQSKADGRSRPKTKISP